MCAIKFLRVFAQEYDVPCLFCSLSSRFTAILPALRTLAQDYHPETSRANLGCFQRLFATAKEGGHPLVLYPSEYSRPPEAFHPQEPCAGDGGAFDCGKVPALGIRRVREDAMAVRRSYYIEVVFNELFGVEVKEGVGSLLIVQDGIAEE